MERWMTDLADWWAALPAEWVFLFVLPFLVALTALAADRRARDGA